VPSGRPCYTDQFKSYRSLKQYGKLLPFDHSAVYAHPRRRGRHINCIERS
jgi:hypothetical protein